MDFLVFILTIIGGVTILGFIIMIGMILWDFATDCIRTFKWRHKYKHRFDKTPTAQCYCKDCKYFRTWKINDETGRCGRGHIEHWTVADNYFCWQAEPLKSEPEMVEEGVN